ncbi:MAG: CBS domain-containing protein [Methanomicrobiaceae archaeon]|nr:CBS domain-containing protein [Methanomicrobiaceae archaeon]
MQKNGRNNKNNKNNLVNEISTADVITVSPRMSIIGAVETMAEKGFRRLPVADSGTGKVLGIVTAGDIINFIGGGEKFNLVSKKHKGNMIAALNDSVREIMSPKVLSVRENSRIQDVAALIVNKKCGGIPILDCDGVIKGIVTERDVLKVLISQDNYLTVKDVMTPSPYITSPDNTVTSVAKEMIVHRFRRLPVVSEDVLFGIITAMDIMKYVGNGSVFKKLVTGNVSDIMSVSVREVMSDNLYTTSPEISIRDAANQMLEKNVGALPVIENSNLVGVITEFDLVRVLSQGGD